ncbi:right-handed parallel beta-helix repeat-containing protein [Kitasatospora kazusensis]|uniref:right-handed parallel beta-helix repeat-containing protein n=1 Tax=Kitasatospora kazusensis TaxID=407974 RepID=UPI0031D60E83
MADPGTERAELSTVRIKRNRAVLPATLRQIVPTGLAFALCAVGLRQPAMWRTPLGWLVAGGGTALWTWALGALLVRLFGPARLVLTAEGLELHGSFRRLRLRWADLAGVSLLPAPRQSFWSEVWGARYFQGRLLVRPLGAGSDGSRPPGWVPRWQGIVFDLRHLAVTPMQLDGLFRRYAGDLWYGAAALPPAQDAVRIPGRMLSRPAVVLGHARPVLALLLGGLAAACWPDRTVAAEAAVCSAALAYAAVTAAVTGLSALCLLELDDRRLHLTVGRAERSLPWRSAGNVAVTADGPSRRRRPAPWTLRARLAPDTERPVPLRRWDCLTPGPDGLVGVAPLLSTEAGHRHGLDVFPEQLTDAMSRFGARTADPEQEVLTLRVSLSAATGHRTISSALRAGGRGRPLRVLIGPGRYTEDLTVDGEVELSAADGPGTVVIDSAAEVGVSCSGTVTLVDLEIVNRRTAAVRTTGRTVLRRCRVTGHGEFAVQALPGSELTLNDCELSIGRTALTGARGTLEASRFLDARDDAVLLSESAEATLAGCVLSNSRACGVSVRGSRVWLKDCEFTGSGSHAVSVADHAEAELLGCRVRDVHGIAIGFYDQAGGSVERTTVSGATHGVYVSRGADPAVRGCRFEDCRTSGVTVDEQGLGRFEDCDFDRTGDTGIGIGTGGAPTVQNCRITDGKVGVVIRKGRGHFTGLDIRRHTSSAVWLREETSAVFEGLRLENCASGVFASGDGSTVNLADAVIRDMSNSGIALDAQARVEVVRATIERTALFGFNCRGSSHLTVKESTVTGPGEAGLLVIGGATVVAEGLTVTGSLGRGVLAKENGWVTVSDSAFRDSESEGVRIEGDCHGGFTDCEVSGSRGEAIVRNGKVTFRNVRTGAAPGPGTTGTTGAEDAEDAAVRAALAELDELIGLAAAKKQVRSQIDLLRLAGWRREAGLAAPPAAGHLVFSGPPGTGKTTVARLYAQTLTALGALPKGHLVEVSRGDLVGEYLGSTSQKTRNAFERAHGGVLFIDEAYSLSRKFGANHDFGQEAIDELTKLMEDHRDEVVVIAAGYTEEMQNFLAANPGLKSRFSRTLEFAPFSPEELADIVRLQALKGEFALQDGIGRRLVEHFEHRSRQGDPANGRDARTLFEQMVERQAGRLARGARPSREELLLLVAADLPEL